MTDQHPITPPRELISQWLDELLPHKNWHKNPEALLNRVFADHIATKAVSWGADQELEACCSEMDDWGNIHNSYGWALSQHLRTARRPKPLSLKDQALAKLEAMERLWEASGNESDDTIRRALEQLDD